MTAAILVAVLVFVMPPLIIAAFVHGVRYEARRRPPQESWAFTDDYDEAEQP
jgi:hypothetical protein